MTDNNSNNNGMGCFDSIALTLAVILLLISILSLRQDIINIEYALESRGIKVETSNDQSLLDKLTYPFKESKDSRRTSKEKVGSKP